MLPPHQSEFEPQQQHLILSTWVVAYWWECFTLNQRFQVRALGMEKNLVGSVTPPPNGPCSARFEFNRSSNVKSKHRDEKKKTCIEYSNIVSSNIYYAHFVYMYNHDKDIIIKGKTINISLNYRNWYADILRHISVIFVPLL